MEKRATENRELQASDRNRSKEPQASDRRQAGWSQQQSVEIPEAEIKGREPQTGNGGQRAANRQ